MKRPVVGRQGWRHAVSVRPRWRLAVTGGLLTAALSWWVSPASSHAADPLLDQTGTVRSPAEFPAQQDPLRVNGAPPQQVDPAKRPASPSPARAVEDTSTLIQETTQQMAEVWQLRQYLARRRVNHVLYRDRELAAQWSSSLESRDAGRILDALEGLQLVLTTAHDTFVWNESDTAPRSLREAASRELDELSAEELAVYERFAGAAADALLQEARAAGDPARLRDVTLKYPRTRAAQAAHRELALLLFDHGRVGESAVHWRRVIESPQPRPLPADELLKAAVALEQIAPGSGATALSTRAHEELRLNSQSHTLAEWLNLSIAQSAVASIPQTSTATWTTPGGSIHGVRDNVGSLPYHRPLWTTGTAALANQPPLLGIAEPSVPLDADQRRRVDAHEQWYRSQLAEENPVVTACVPIIAGDRILMRDMHDIVARDLATGVEVWRHRCATALNFQRAPPPSVPGTPSGPLTAWDQTCSENSLLGSLTTDGERVYFVDEVTETPLPLLPPALGQIPNLQETRPVASTLSNRLVALRLATSSNAESTAAVAAAHSGELSLPAWSIGGADRDGKSRSPLAGHFFLGPPVPHEDHLFVLTESHGEVHLACLVAATGEVEFAQPLALLDRPVANDRERMRIAFLPSFAAGLWICPTPSGTVVAFRHQSRTLAWAALYRGSEFGGTVNWRGDGRPAASVSAVQPVIDGDLVYLLPPDSVQLHAWHLATGAEAWVMPRQGGLQVLVGEDSLHLVATDRINSLDPDRGTLRWQTSVRGVAGRGLMLSGRIVIPRTDGRLGVIDARTGTWLGRMSAESLAGQQVDARPLLRRVDLPDGNVEEDAARRRLGNLIAVHDCVVSTSPVETTLLLQAESLKQVLQPTGTAPLQSTHRALLAHATRPFADQSPHLLKKVLAEVHLTLGETEAATAQLSALLQHPEGAPAEVVEDVRQLLVELLFARLPGSEPDDVAHILAELRPWCRGATDEARWQLASLRIAAATADVETMLAATEALARLPDEFLVAGPTGESHRFHPAQAIGAEWEKLRVAIDPSEWNHIEELAHSRLAFAAAGDRAALLRLERQFPGFDAADQARLALAQLDREAGHLLGSEAHLLTINDSAIESSRLQARRELASLRRAAGAIDPFAPPASSVIARLAYVGDDSEIVPASLVDTGAELTALADRPAATILGITLTERAALLDAGPYFPSGNELAALLENRGELSLPATCAFRVVNTGEPQADTGPVTAAATERSEINLAIVGKTTGATLATVRVPARSHAPEPAFQPREGHFLPLADTQVHGLSLLDAKLLWTVGHADSTSRAARVRLGPSGPGYCIVQSSAGIVCLDPATGDTLWERRDIADDSGLFANDDHGICGDAEAVVVFESDLRNCRVFSTRTGELMHRGELPIDPRDLRRRRLTFGRRVYFVTGASESNPRYRVWDPLQNRLLLDEPAHPRLCDAQVDRDAIALLNEFGEVLIINVRSGDVLLRHEVPENLLAELTSIRVWRDRDLWLVHMAHGGATGSTLRYETANTEVQLPSQPINGTLAAIDVETSRPLWTEVLHKRTVLMDSPADLPFLISLSRIQESPGVTPSRLLIELIDRRTGQSLAKRTDLARERFVHLAHDAAAETLMLEGTMNRVEIRYSRGPDAAESLALP
jgi:outer membrane protein assembly factor BamB